MLTFACWLCYNTHVTKKEYQQDSKCLIVVTEKREKMRIILHLMFISKYAVWYIKAICSRKIVLALVYTML